jgi:hypothetical protein
MAEWKKVVVSGSSAELAGLTLTTALSITNGGTGATTAGAARTALGLGTAAVADSSDFLAVTSNLSDLDNAGTARTNLGLGSAALAASSDFFAASSVSTFGASLVDDADASAARTTLGLGTSATTAASDYATAAQGTKADDALPSANVSSFGGTLIDDANASAARTTLGLGSVAVLNSIDLASDVSTTILPVGNGGTNLGALGSALQVLRVNSTGTALEYASPAEGDVTGINGGTAITITDGGTATPTVNVTDGGIGATQLASAVAGDGLAGGAGTALSVNVDDSSIEISGDSLRVKGSGITNDMLAGSIANSKLANDGITIAGSDISLGGSITADTIAGQLSDGAISSIAKVTGLTSALSGKADLTGANFSGNVVVAGDLTVQGTASFESTENLLVKDKFIMLASGSAGATDGGIVIEQANPSGGATGAVFAYDGLSSGRWGIDTSFNPTGSSYTPKAFMSAVVIGSGANPVSAAPTSDYVKAGNIYAATDETLWIYSA